MLKSLVTVNGWVDEFEKKLVEQYGELEHATQTMLFQLKELLNAFDRCCIITVTNEKGQIIEVNDTFCELSGYEREEIIGNNHRMLNSNHHPPAFFKEMWKTIRSGRVWSGEVKNRRKDGSYFWLKSTIFPICDERNKPVKYLSIRTDITEGKLYEEKMRKLIEQDYSTLIKNQQNLVMRAYLNGENVPTASLIEGRLANQLGLMREPGKQELVSDILGNPSQKPLIRQHFKRAFSGKESKFEFQHGERFLHAMLSPVGDGNSAVKEVVVSVSDITELKKSEMTVRSMAYTDGLTELPNRRLLEEDLHHRLMEVRKKRKNAGLIVIDLDQFKNINDTLGHYVGDQILLKAAKRLLRVKMGDYVEGARLYHISGDEFAWLIHGFEEHQLPFVMERILTVFEEPFYDLNREIIQKASMGVSLYPSSAAKADELMKHADMALYTAKNAGGNTYRFFSSEMKGVFLSKIQLENDLRSALKTEGQFQLYYQPVISSGEEKVMACEALLRWHHPLRGILSPLEFISTAEKTGLIVPLGEWIIRQACTDLLHFDHVLEDELVLSVNISPVQLQQQNFVGRLKMIVDQYRVSPERIQLEITENGLMENTSDSLNTFRQLRELGFGIAIDDFGTGYSSFSYLKQFPVHCLKMDKSFVKDLPREQADRAIVSSTIKLGKDLGLVMVAEGVESKEAYEYLATIGCPFLQGYFFSEPVPLPEFTKFVLERRTEC